MGVTQHFPIRYLIRSREKLKIWLLVWLKSVISGHWRASKQKGYHVQSQFGTVGVVTAWPANVHLIFTILMWLVNKATFSAPQQNLSECDWSLQLLDEVFQDALGVHSPPHKWIANLCEPWRFIIMVVNFDTRSTEGSLVAKIVANLWYFACTPGKKFESEKTELQPNGAHTKLAVLCTLHFSSSLTKILNLEANMYIAMSSHLGKIANGSKLWTVCLTESNYEAFRLQLKWNS